MHQSDEPLEPRFEVLPAPARIYISLVVAAGAVAAATMLPSRIDRPVLFCLLLVVGYVTSTWKVNLPLPLVNGSTLSVSYAADLMALLLLGPPQAMIVAMLGAWAQCVRHQKRPCPVHQTVFSVAAVAVTMRAVAATFEWVNGTAAPASLADLTKPLVAVITVYFVVNTVLIALAIAFATRQPVWPVWRDNFLWSGPSFIVAGGAGALAAIVVAHGDYWLAPLLAAPVYLTFRTYHVFLGRIEDERRHVVETRKLHRETLDALSQAQAAERALAAEKERLAVTLRSVGDGVIATDAGGAVRVLNRAGEFLTGWSQEEASGRPLADVFQTLDSDTRMPYDHSIRRVEDSDNPLGVARSGVLVSRDGREIPSQEVCAPLRDGDGRIIGLVVAFRDASDAIKVQEERTKASKLESLGLLAGGIAHDFNNILTAILGNVSLARSSDLDEDADVALVAAEEACVRARQLTQQLLTFSKGGAPVKRPLRLDRVIMESVGMALSGATASRITDVDPNLWVVNADEGQLIQVFNNIIINAAQAMPRGGRILVRAENITEPVDRWEFGLKVKAGPYVQVAISDEGIGIRPADFPKIFDPYFTTKPAGSGLGLATSRSIVKNHGGYIAVESAVGLGTTLRVCLPATLAAQPQEQPLIGRGPALGGGRVLVLDDEESIRRLAVRLLDVLGYEADAVSTGTAAIERYVSARKTGRPFDFVILDLTIPGEAGGADVLRALKVVDPDVRAIVCSGYASDAVLANYRNYGFRAVVSKPFTINELSAALMEVAKATTA
jgi:PAS domain S-box-containing protein